MANIDNLNFKVILDDKDFNKKIKELENIAKQFNTNITNALQLKGHSQNLSQKEVQARRRALQAAVDEARAQEKINREKAKTEGLQKKINTQINRITDGYKTQRNTLSDLSGLAMQYFSFRGIASLISSIVRITGEFELQKVALGAMINDLGAAEHIMTKIKALAIESPFQYRELATYAKQLSAFSVPKEELFDTVNMIADLSAGLGVSADRLILAYGQVKSAAFLRGQEVRQFTEAGIPLLQELANEFSALEERVVSAGEVFDKISTRQVPFEMVAKVLKDMTSEGGKFFQMQQIQSDTLWGKVRKLKDAWEIALGEIGKKNGTVIHGVLDTLIDMAKNWERVGNILRTLIITYGVYKAALLAAWVVEKAIVTVEMAKHFIQAIKGVKGLTQAMTFLRINLSSILGFFGILGGLIYAFSTSSGDAAEETYDLNKELQKLHNNSVTLSNALDRDISYLQSLTKGTESYRNAVSSINELYKEYLPSLVKEADSYDDIKKKAEEAQKAITEKARQDALTKAREDIDRKYGGGNWKEEYDKMYEYFRNQFGAQGVDFVNQVLAEIVNKSLTGYDADRAFENVFKRYFQVSEDDWVTRWKDLYMGINPPFDIHFALSGYADYHKELEAAYERVNQLFTEATWTTYNEYANVTKIANERDKKLAEISAKELSDSEHRKESLKIEKEYLESLIDYYTKAGNSTMAIKYQKDLEAFENFWKEWRGKVQDLLAERGYTETSSFGLWTTDATSSKDYAEKLVKDYKEVTETISSVGGFDPNITKKLEEQKKTIEAIAALLNVDLSGRKRSSGKSELERKIDALSALKKAYDDLKALNLSDTTIIQMLKDGFPDIVNTYGDTFIESLDFTNRILAFGRELKRTEPDRANSILQSLGLDNLSNDKKVIKDAVDAAKKYFEAIRKLQTSDFSIEGEGVAFDIGKIANQLSNKFRDIDLNAKKISETFKKIDLNDAEAVESIKNTFEKEFGEGTWDTFYKGFVEGGDEAVKRILENFVTAEQNYERKLAQERLNDIASKYVKESLENIDMSHWGEKSINQIEAIRQRIIDLMNAGIELPESTLTKLNELGLSTEDLKVAIKELFGEKYDNATIEKFKALSKLINQVTSVVKSLGGELEKLGETLGDDMVSDFGKSLQSFDELTKILTECDSLMQALGKTAEETKEETSETAEETKKAAEDLKNVANSSDLITLAIKLAASLITKVVSGINESQKALIDARMAAIEYANALQQLEYNQLMESRESVFGTDEYKQAIDSMRKAAEYQQSALDATKEIGVTSKEIYSATNSSFWGSISKGARDMRNAISALGIGDILVDARTGWQRFWGTGRELVQIANISDFIDEDGMLKGEELRAWMKANGEHISQDNKEVLTRMLNDYDLYVQAVEDANAYLGEMFNGVAESMADAYVEAFKASGEAALDYADIMDEVATNIAKSVVKSMIIDEIASPKKIKQMSNLLFSGDEAGAMEIFDETMRAAQEIAPRIQAFLEKMQPYFKMGEDDGQNLGDGIKRITEDTANLLASYLNAIRADVSYARTIWERMDATTQQIASILVNLSVPNLMEYQAQIAANTYNTAMNTQSIMEDLRSMMTSEGGYTALRVYS